MPTVWPQLLLSLTVLNNLLINLPKSQWPTSDAMINPVHTYPTSGTLHIKYTIINANGSASAASVPHSAH